MLTLICGICYLFYFEHHMPTSIIKFLKGLHLMALSDIDDWNGIIRMEGIFLSSFVEISLTYNTV